MPGIELKILTDSPALAELCREYWRMEGDVFPIKVSELAKRFEIQVWQVPTIVINNSYASAAGHECPSCNRSRPFTSRSNYQQCLKEASWRPGWVCDDCRTAERRGDEDKARNQAELRAGLLSHEVDEARALGLSVRSLSFRDTAYLLSMIRLLGAEDLSFLFPERAVDGLLAPTPEMSREVLEHVFHRKLLCIHPDSTPESVIIEGDGFGGFLPSHVHWTLPLDDSLSPEGFVAQLENSITSAEWPHGWAEEASALYEELAVAECLQYLTVVLDEHGFSFRAGEKTRLILSQTLKTFSIGQTCNFICRAAGYAASFYLRKQTSRAHAANTVPSSIQRQAEKALSEGWLVKPYRRDFRAPESVLTQVVFTMALHLTDGGRVTVPLSGNITTQRLEEEDLV